MEENQKNLDKKTTEEAIAEMMDDVKINPNLIYFYLGVFSHSLGKIDDAINHLEKYLEKEPDDYRTNFLIGEIYVNQGQFQKASQCLKKIVFDIKSKDDFETLDNIINKLKDNEQFEIAKDLLSNVSDMNFQLTMGYPLSWEVKTVGESEMQFKVLKARQEERNKVISDLSHTLKNIVGTVVDPLENLKEAKQYIQTTIDNALRGANLVREITNAMNYSLKGGIEDFYYDSGHNQGRESKNLVDIVVTSIKNSVVNIFDSKYFGVFTHKYFPDKKSYGDAKSEWEITSQKTKIAEITPFLEKYYFTPEFELGNLAGYVMGNDKGSAVKLLILLQEMIFNAVKYSAFVSRGNRFVRIKFIDEESTITLLVENRFKPKVKVKTTGLGHVILKNFADMLNTTLEVKTKDEVYSVKITIPNFWKEKKHEDSIR